MTRLSKTLFVAAALLAAPVSSALAQDAPPDGEQPAGGEGGEGMGGEGMGGEGMGGGEAAPVDATQPPPDAGADGMVTYTTTTWPTALNERPLTLGKGMIEIHADVFVNMSSDAVAKPFAISPDIWYGVSDKLTVGLTHGLGLCLAGEENGCGKVYNDVGVNARFSVKRDAKMEIAVRGGLNFISLDPMAVRLAVGGSLKYVAGQIGIYVDPTLEIGLNKRESVLMLPGNTESLAIPVKVAFQATPQLAPYLRTGIGGVFGSDPFAGGALLDGFGDNWGIPLGVGALYGLSNKIDVGAEFFFPAIAGSDFSSSDARALLLFGNFRI